MKNKAIYIGIGSNLRSFSHKNVNIFFNCVIYRLNLLGLRVQNNSGLWVSNPMPFKSGPTYYNSVIECRYPYNYYENADNLLKKILILKKKLGKKIKGINKQRVIDIDIIDFYGCVISNTVILPHPRMHLRKFVLGPLFTLNKYWTHPIRKKNCIFLIANLRGNQFIKKK